MLKNNNHAVVKKISERTLKQNRTRNIFVVLAIILTTFMFTTVFSIGFSLAENINLMMLRQQGTKTTITLRQPSKEQIKKAEKADNLNAAGIKVQTGKAVTSDGESAILLDYYDKTEFEENYTPAVSDIKGKYPQKAGEIMLSKAALEALHIKEPKLGEKIVLLVDSEEKSFELSGWFTDYAYISSGFQGFVSEEYVRSLGLKTESDGVLCLSAKTGKQSQLYEELENLVPLGKNQEWETTYDVQEENSGNFVVVIAAIGMIGLIILISGYLLIYNVMYISISKDIRFYGMLKTIGTSPSQIKKIVRMQAEKLSLLGIPIGMILGTIVSFVAVPIALRTVLNGTDSVMPSDISFNPFIYAGTTVFAIITVLISCRKPAKFAGKVSPIEALKYNGKSDIKAKSKKSTSGGRIYRMAFRNVFREKKRAILVFASLFMGTMAFLSVNTFLGSMKLENYVDYYLPNDYTIYTNSGDEENTQEEENNIITSAEKLAEDIKKIDGVTKVSVNRSADTIFEFDEDIFMPFLKNASSDESELEDMIRYYKNPPQTENAYSAPVVAVSSGMMEEYNKKAFQKIDIERFEKGEVCLLGFVNSKEQADSMLGKSITLIDKKSQKIKSIEIGSCPVRGDDHGINVGYYWMRGGAPDIVLISETALRQFCDTTSVDNIIVDCNPKTEQKVTSKIKELVKTNPAVLQTEIKSEQIESFKSAMTAMDILGGGISIVLILIGVINFVNVMLTAVYTRRGELAVMESVGMTKKQIKKMLTFEGAYYGILTIALILSLGNVIVYMVAVMAQSVADYAVFHYPAAWMAGIVAVIMAICIIVPKVVYRMLSKETVTERLRSGEE